MIDLNRPLTIKDNPTIVVPLYEIEALQVLADRRLELLRRVVDYIEWLGNLNDESEFDIKSLEDDLAKELGGEHGTADKK